LFGKSEEKFCFGVNVTRVCIGGSRDCGKCKFFEGFDRIKHEPSASV